MPDGTVFTAVWLIIATLSFFVGMAYGSTR